MLYKHVIGLSGRLGSGKSSLASVLSEQSRWPKAGFGDYLRHLAEQRGLGIDRRALQQLGEEQIAQGWDAFCSDVLEHFGWRSGAGLVVDGIRHAEAVRTLNALIRPQEVFLVHLAVDEEIRQVRLASRDGDLTRMEEIERHSTEAQVRDTLPEAAHLIVNGNRPVRSLAGEVWEALRSKSPKGSWVPEFSLPMIAPSSSSRCTC